MIGSHVDSVPNGGWLDGALGVMGALETLRSIAAQGTPPCTVTLVDWADEEGARFGRSLFGSSAVAGTLDPDAVRDLRDADGKRLEDVVREHGVELDRASAAQRRLRDVRAYLELHIEQGPVLEGLGAAGRHRARHGRRRAQPRDLPRPGGARRLDADDPPARLLPRRGALRARRARRGDPPRRRVHDRQGGLQAGRRHGDRRRDRAAARSAPPRRRRARRAAGRVAHAGRRGRGGREVQRRVGAALARSSRSRSTPP